jgi:hypothetical protein
MPGLSSRRHVAPPPQLTAELAVRQSQIITLAMIIGLLLGGGTLGFMGLKTLGGLSGTPAPSTPPLPPPLPAAPGAATLTEIFSIAVPVLWVVMLAIVVLVPGFLARSARKRWEARADDDAAMRRVYLGFSTMSILHAAMMEGPGLFGAVATLLTGNALFLLAPLASVIVLTALFPRASRMNRWIEEATGVPPFRDAFGGAPNLPDDEAA